MADTQYVKAYDSPIGVITIASDGERITGLWFEGQKYYAATLQSPVTDAALPVFDRAAAWLDRYFGGERPEMNLPLKPEGSTFRQAVWHILLGIPYGETLTYGSIAQELARSTGKNVSAQAVGGAVGHNPISILIPCHRVVGADGSLTGYAGGIDKKIRLLQLEGAETARLYVPRSGTAL